TRAKVVKLIFLDAIDAPRFGGIRRLDAGKRLDLIDRPAEAIVSKVGDEHDVRIGLGNDLGRFHALHSSLFEGHLTAGELDHLAHAAAVTAAAFADDEIDI